MKVDTKVALQATIFTHSQALVWESLRTKIPTLLCGTNDILKVTL